MQFMQMINQLPPDAVEDILLGAGVGALGGVPAEGGGEMPGQMPGFEGVMQEEMPVEEVPHPTDEEDVWDEDAGEDDSGDDEDVSVSFSFILNRKIFLTISFPSSQCRVF
jgi:hypothetical protein